MTKHLLSLLALAASAVAAPTPPPLTYLYSVNLTMPAGTDLGHVPYRSRALLPISGGTFSGPKLNGKGLTDSKGIFSPDAVYALHTDDNSTIMVTEKGHAPHVHILFETSSDKYAWLNRIVGYATGGPFEGGVALDVWQVS
ncbi:hypothetical protein QBC45DRAFT_455288 [Copromyces sp. CBS 386.78]|nr:hypothetical protein QBC45DRAFT_455288 [Copromyces sp. CBS 386.78]